MNKRTAYESVPLVGLTDMSPMSISDDEEWSLAEARKVGTRMREAWLVGVKKGNFPLVPYSQCRYNGLVVMAWQAGLRFENHKKEVRRVQGVESTRVQNRITTFRDYYVQLNAMVNCLEAGNIPVAMDLFAQMAGGGWNPNFGEKLLRRSTPSKASPDQIRTEFSLVEKQNPNQTRTQICELVADTLTERGLECRPDTVRKAVSNKKPGRPPKL